MDYQDIEALEERTELPVYAKLALAIERGEGSYVWDSGGRRYLDLYGGHAVALTGHSHPAVVRAIADQARTLLFYSNAVRSSVRARASERLLAHAPQGMRVFYVNSGAEANEAALKTARKHTGREVVVCFEGAFHGRTAATLALAGFDKYRKSAGPELLASSTRRIPWDDVGALEAAVAADTAAVILEPIQSLGGVRMGSEAFYRALRELTRARGAALIFDEIQTGLGRTGRFFFGEHVGVEPDMITLAKGIASGVPAAAALVGAPFAEHMHKGDHGSTFGGGPLALAAVEATLRVIEDEGLADNAARVGRAIAAACCGLPGVVEVRGLGLLLGIVLDRDAKPVQKALERRGVLVGGADDPRVLRLLPPLTLRESELVDFRSDLAASLEETARAPALAPAAAPAAVAGPRSP